MSDEMTEAPRSIRRAALMGNRREILAVQDGRNFTIKDARDLLLRWSNFTNQGEDGRGDERVWYIARSQIVHFVWRRFFPEHEYIRGRHQRYPLYLSAKWVQKADIEILLGAERQLRPLKRFVDLCTKTLIQRGFIKPEPRPGRVDGDLLYWHTPDGHLLATAAWYAPLTKQKADTLIQGVLDRAIEVAQNPDDYLVRVELLGVFGGYTDEDVTEINDIDMLLEYHRVEYARDRDKNFAEWQRRAEDLFERDDRIQRSIFDNHLAWPWKKLSQFLRSRNPRLRIISGTTVGQPIRLKVLYRHPEGVLKKPFVVDLPDGNHGPAWDALMKKSR